MRVFESVSPRQVRDGFSPVSLLSNPMALFALAGCFFIFIMPKILGSMDPEELAEFKRQQAAMNPAAMLQNMQKKVEQATSQQQATLQHKNK